jgi:hypothetical protein
VNLRCRVTSTPTSLETTSRTSQIPGGGRNGGDNALPPPQLAEAIGTSLAIANGEASPSTPLTAPNYPRDTVICDNRSSYRNGDFPPAGLMSTLIGCADGIITSTARVVIDNSQPTAGTATFTVHLDAQPAGDVVVAVTSTDGNVAAVSPAPLVFTQATMQRRRP